MFKKLRIKFIAITMVMVTCVMVLSFIGVCIAEYQRTYATVQTALSDAIDKAEMSNSRFEFGNGHPQPRSNQQQSTSSSSNASSSASSTSASSSANIASASASLGNLFAIPSLPLAYAEEPAPNSDNPRQMSGTREQMFPDGNQSNQSRDPNQPFPPEQPGSNPQASPNDADSAPGTGSDANFDRETSDSERNDSGQGNGMQSDTQNPSQTDAFQQAPGSGSSQISDQPEISIDDDSLENTAPPAIGGRDREIRISTLIPVAVYKMSSDGTFSAVAEVTTASISSDVLREAAEIAYSSSTDDGTLNDLGLHYLKRLTNSTTYFAFADTSYTDGWKSLAGILIAVGIVTLIVFFLISLLYSKWALKPVSDAWDSQRRFVADASHDLKTPLTVVLANASILLKHPDHTIASESQWIESTQKEAENMQGLVNEMLELAQIESRAAIQHEPVDFSDLVDGETLLFDSVALERNCNFTCKINEGITVSGNHARLSKMVSTLIENAFKYVDESGSIDIALSHDSKTARLSIRNSGSTIAAEDLPHIFDRFYRTDKARTSDTGGFGLGLAIAREIAREHDGDIVCASSESVGTTFTVTLPIFRN